MPIAPPAIPRLRRHSSLAFYVTPLSPLARCLPPSASLPSPPAAISLAGRSPLMPSAAAPSAPFDLVPAACTRLQQTTICHWRHCCTPLWPLCLPLRQIHSCIRPLFPWLVQHPRTRSHVAPHASGTTFTCRGCDPDQATGLCLQSSIARRLFRPPGCPPAKTSPIRLASMMTTWDSASGRWLEGQCHLPSLAVSRPSSCLRQ